MGDVSDQLESHLAALKHIVADNPEPREGNSAQVRHSLYWGSQLEPKQRNISMLARGARDILEIGFNAGHSVLIMALANPASRIVAFDCANHNYTLPCYHYLSNAFPDRIELVVGDSRDTLSGYADSTQRRFDLILIDGGHSPDVLSSNYANARKLANPRAVVLMDDLQLAFIKRFWVERIEAGEIEPMPLHDVHAYPHAAGSVVGHPGRKRTRLIVTASIGRSSQQYAEASARQWAARVGAELWIRNEPYAISGTIVHPWFAKWDMVADAVEARDPDEVCWLDDDIIVRADAEWPDYPQWAALEANGGQELGGGNRLAGALQACQYSGADWTPTSGYYNTGLVFKRSPNTAEFREMGALAQNLEYSLIPDQAAFAIHLCDRPGVRQFTEQWHVRAPQLENDHLPGYFNHFLGGYRHDMNAFGDRWMNIPRRAWVSPAISGVYRK
jgi:predicted O-methyltransferase YrrM